jgi:hypothetical protein
LQKLKHKTLDPTLTFRKAQLYNNLKKYNKQAQLKTRIYTVVVVAAPTKQQRRKQQI